MSHASSNLERRSFLQWTAALGARGALASIGGGASPARAAALPPAATGKPGDFDFLTGEWSIKHRQMKNHKWDLFTGEATVVGILGGIASIEELRIPERNFSGMGLRLLDRERKLWADWWVNSQSGVLGGAPAWGSFVNGVGNWDGDDVDAAGKAIIVRGCWDKITATSCRWYQATSKDDGKSWQESWVMDWTRKSR